MKILNRVGGAFLLLVLGMAVILGFQSSTGRPVWNEISSAVGDVLSYLRSLIQRLGGTSIAGNASLAIAIAAVGMIVVLFLLKKPVSLGTFTAMVLIAGAGAAILYNPSLVG